MKFADVIPYFSMSRLREDLWVEARWQGIEEWVISMEVQITIMSTQDVWQWRRSNTEKRPEREKIQENIIGFRLEQTWTCLNIDGGYAKKERDNEC